jgi:hypothetical protein
MTAFTRSGAHIDNVIMPAVGRFMILAAAAVLLGAKLFCTGEGYEPTERKQLRRVRLFVEVPR